MMRSIPACAGDPPWRYANRLGLRVYPRVCGGSARRRLSGRRPSGLSPRVRGIPNRKVGALCGWAGSGSIPACAGDPDLGACERRRDGVYPRVCGGSRRPTFRGRRLWGLSPRVRGIQGQDNGDMPNQGSIPACAGDPTHKYTIVFWRKVYPRVCGGSTPLNANTMSGLGLSPRVRGIPTGGKPKPPTAGSIPACAGDPLSASQSDWMLTVYPRVCGGSISALVNHAADKGLSPRVRGIQ